MYIVNIVCIVYIVYIVYIVNIVCIVCNADPDPTTTKFTTVLHTIYAISDVLYIKAGATLLAP